MGEGGSKEERRAPHSRAKPAPSLRDAPTSAVPPSPGGRLWAGSGDSGKAALRLPEGSGGRGAHPRAVPQLPPPPPHRVPQSAGPRPARAGAWPGTRPRPERGARTSSRPRNYRASRRVGIELISGDYLATPPVQTTGGFLSQSAGVSARAVRSPGEGERTGETHRPAATAGPGRGARPRALDWLWERASRGGAERARACAVALGPGDSRYAARRGAARRSRKRAWAGGAGCAQGSARPRAREGGAGDSAERLPASAPRERTDGREGPPDARSAA